MILELPKKFKHKNAEIVDDTLMIFQLERFEELNYELTYALKKKKCIYCDTNLKHRNRTLDHRYPRATGGVSITNNLFPCCSKCNSKKTNLTHKEFMVFRKLDKEERQEYMEFVNDYKEKILNRIGYVLPNKWVEYMSVEDIKYRKITNFVYGKKFSKIKDFYDAHNHLPRPIIVDKENNVLDGYNVFMLAKEYGILFIPVIKLKNVILVYDKSEHYLERAK